ncbi:MAG: hypothetical protein AB1414_05600 [bacterium]
MQLIKKIDNDSRNLIFNILITIILKGGSVILSLLTVPAYLRYFSNDTYLGLWFTILSILTWILTFDLGIGNGLRNYLVKTIADRDDLKSSKYITGSYFIFSILSVFVFLVAIILSQFLNYNKIFNVSSNIIQNSTIRVAFMISLFGILLHFTLKLIYSLLYALQKPFLVNFLSLVTSLSIFIFITLLNTGNLSDKLVYVSIFYVLATNVPTLVITLVLFLGKYRKMRPKLKNLDFKFSQSVINIGGLFFFIQIMYLLINATNELFISQVLNPSSVIDYQFYYKLFTLAPVMLSILLIPIWSAVTKALHEKRHEWIKKTYLYTHIVLMLLVIVQLIIIFLSQFLFNIWLGINSFTVDISNLVIMAIYGVIFSTIAIQSTFSNGMNILRAQFYSYIVGVFLKFILTFIFWDWIMKWNHLILINIISLIPFIVIVTSVNIRLIYGDSKRLEEKEKLYV